MVQLCHSDEVVSKQNLQTGVNTTVSHTVDEIEFFVFYVFQGAFSKFSKQNVASLSPKRARKVVP